MIVVWGARSDPPVARVLDALAARRADVVHIEDPAHVEYELAMGASLDGWLAVGGRRVEVSSIDGMYARPSASAAGCPSATVAALAAVASWLPVPVVNRPVAGRSNWSKPFQSTLLRAAGFDVPETLVTSDACAARAFVDRHGCVVYKSVSGVRSIVNTIDSSSVSRLDCIGTGPVQLQRWVDGVDVRVHVVGDRWFATEVVSDAIDYRYGSSVGDDVELRPTVIPEEIGKRLIALNEEMGLLLSGADLRLVPSGGWCAFEVNPSPGFSFYEDATGQPIAAAITDLLLM